MQKKKSKNQNKKKVKTQTTELIDKFILQEETKEATEIIQLTEAIKAYTARRNKRINRNNAAHKIN